MIANGVPYKCGICDSHFQLGPHKYPGRLLNKNTYGDVVVCMICYRANHDGFNPGAEKMLLDHIKRQGLPIPERNKNGLLPR